ncbi:uncharacterized protein LOC110985859 [Acanthaster planci]|uniref:Uncharacterized protein LOC110985859 n=1 Tax=Acanthaster planci TaxID=133434 RepID=A0A8B7ZDR3_ACAPL|nr:uncharacterized protein LOC110985859 [Acanthaster planci]
MCSGRSLLKIVCISKSENTCRGRANTLLGWPVHEAPPYGRRLEGLGEVFQLSREPHCMQAERQCASKTEDKPAATASQDTESDLGSPFDADDVVPDTDSDLMIVPEETEKQDDDEKPSAKEKQEANEAREETRIAKKTEDDESKPSPSQVIHSCMFRRQMYFYPYATFYNSVSIRS